MFKKPKRKSCKNAPKEKRGPRGRGSVFPDKRRGGFRAKVPVGRYENGHTRYVEVWGETQAAAIAKMELAQPPGTDTTVSEWSDRWLDALDVRPSTLGDYTFTVTHFIKPTLGHMRVTAVTAGDVERAQKVWSARLGPNTLKKNVGHLAALFHAARRSGLVAVNPVSVARRPKPKKVESRPLPPADLARVIGAVSAHPLDCCYALLAAVGCRVGEMAALDVPDFDPAAGTVSITKTYTKEHGTRDTKTDNGRRTVRVPAAALPAIRLAVGTRTKGPLFVGPTGRRRFHNSLQARWKTVLDRLGLERRGMHQLRHSVATALVSSGVPVGDVAKFLGDTVLTIVTRYLHPAGTDPATKLDELLGGGKVATDPPKLAKGQKLQHATRRRANT